jgi:tetratricopeptide (TPR) repeat protein
MPEQDLAAIVDQYTVGLEAELQLLHRLEEVAAHQQAASTARDLDAMNRAADARDRLMAGIVNIEQELRPLRQILAASRDAASQLPNYEEAAALHQQAIALVGSILKTDEASIESLASAELARRDAARALERGETTLAAYRRVVALAPGATLVDRRG